ncbi:MAG: fatty acid oxidation complex subunit alpha FadJ, partial [Enterobacteriaceae bacterium]
MSEDREQIFQLSWRDNVALLTFTQAEQRYNLINHDFVLQLDKVLQQVAQQPGLRGVILLSGKSDSFIVGADLHLFSRCSSEQEAQTLSHQ